ncbi:DUF11 domain-containing protein [Adhaeribacter swui]|uniref:DUF11 domain-containing protein n=1 Tax=Adhaeribacter swui TaxID=2086471 RepID=A0A7G7G2X3_9BACT|nr:isopeptide-forming domain-containing fimbrial protein [Adhaeribacter swui]QNF31507.1 DUF11 domain-containing protein [Adhaeribacter swui]
MLHLLRKLTFLLFVLNIFGYSAFAQVCISPGKDGPAVSGTIINTYYPGAGTVAIGATSLTLGTSTGSTTPINKGDLVLIIQMQGANINTANDATYGSGNGSGNLTGSSFIAGNYEYALAANNVATSGGTLTLASGTINAYASSDFGATNTTGQRRYQVIRVPQYSALTLSAGITAAAWNGATGGVVVMDVAGQLNFNGQTINVAGLGFRGGAGRALRGTTGLASGDYRSLSTQTAHAQKGEGTAGTPANVLNGGALLNTGFEGYSSGSMGRGAPGNAGGGGSDSNPTANDQNAGGGGGANGGAGGRGGNSWSSQAINGGLGGASFSVAAPGRLVLGGGGGAGTTNDGSGNLANGLASSGAAGGGLVMVRAGRVIGTGTINANGSAANNSVLNDASGGGGAGGSVLLTTVASGGLTGITVTAVGGTGGNNTGAATGATPSPHGPGGGGGGGVIYASSPLASANVTGGANGTTRNANNTTNEYGAIDGSNGIVSTNITTAQLGNSSAGALCLPSLTVTKSTSTPTVYRLTSGTVATYTITVSNSGGSAQGVRVTDALPANVTFNSTVSINLGNSSSYDDVGLTASKAPVLTTTTATITPTAGSSTPVWGTFSIPSGGSVEITFRVNISNTAALNTPIQNSATASYLDPTRTSLARLVTLDNTSTYETGANAGGFVPGSNYAGSSTTNEDVTVRSTVDVAVTNTVVSTSPYYVGQEVTYRITARNNNTTSAATGVVITDVLPAGLSLVSATPGSGTYNTADGTWTVGTLAAGSETILTLVARPTITGNITTTAAKTAQVEPDETTGNNTSSNTITVASPADIAVTNTVAAGNYYNGVNTTFTVTARNNGPSNATNINIVDQLPNTLELVSATPSTGTYNTTNGTWVINSLANAASATLALVVKPKTTGLIKTVATKTSATEFDNNTGNNSAEAGIEVLPNADLIVTNTVAAGSYYRGIQTTYTVTVTNAGPDAASGVTVRDLLPGGLTFNSAQPPAGTTYDRVTGNWVIGSLAKDATVTLTIKATPNTTNAITTTASVVAKDQYDVNEINNTSSNTIYPNAAADIAVTNTVAAGPYYNGVNTTFTVTAKNNGISNASNVSIIDKLPAGLTLVTASPSNGTYSPSDGLWNIGNLVNGAEATLTLVVKPNTSGTITTLATKNSLNEYDNNTANDSQIREIIVSQNADLAITNTVSASPYVVGTNVTYTVTVTNNGPDNTTGVSVKDLLPVDLDFKNYTATTGAGTYDRSTGIWTVGNLNSGATQTLTIIAAPLNNNTITTTASVNNSNIPDNQNANNSASNSIDVDAKPIADIAITNTAAGGNYYNNVPTFFTITAKNNGPGATSGVKVTDQLPPGLNFISAEPSIGTYNSNGGVWDIGNLGSGVTQTLVLHVVPNTTGNITTRATKTAQSISENDPNNGNDFQDATINVLENADLGIVISVGDGPYYVGSTPTFTAKVRNNGPNRATNIKFYDNRPNAFDIPSIKTVTTLGTKYDPTTGYWDIPSLESGAEATITLTGRLIRSGTVSFRVSRYSADQPDRNLANDQDFATITVNPSADIEVTSTVSPEPYINGNEVTYTINAKNLGPSSASGVKITDKLPEGLSFVRAATTAGTYDAGSGVWNIDNIGAGITQTLTLVARPTQTGTFITTAEKTAQTETDPVPGNDKASNTINVGSSADVAASFSVSPGPYYNGVTAITFTGTLVNNGPDAATNVVYFDNRPSELNFRITKVTPSQGDYDPASGYWNVGTIDPLKTATLIVEAIPVKTGDIKIQVTKTGQDQTDPVAENNNASVTVNVQKAADIELSSTQASSPYFVNQQTTFTITAKNNGADNATGVAVRQFLPAGLTLVSTDPSAGTTYEPATRIWTIGDLTVGSSKTITFTVVPTAATTYTARATKSSEIEYDVNGGNNVVNTIFNNVIVHQPAVYTIEPPRNIDSYTDNQSLATVADPDGAIRAAQIISGTLPPGVAFNTTTGQFTVADRNLLVPGSTTVQVRTSDNDGGQTTLSVTLTFLPDAEVGVTVFAAKNFYDYRNGDILATFTDDDGPVVSTSVVSGSGSLPNGLSMPDGHIVVSNRFPLRPGSYPLTVRTVDQTGGITEKALTLVITADRDGDGVDDFTDIDDNNDGITDVVSGEGVDPLGKASNGQLNYYDPSYIHPKYGAFRDRNNDQINDWFDIDLDGIINNFDLDMDGDGIANTIEANGGFVPANFNLIISKYNGGVGSNGMPDYAETSPESGITILPMPDTDGDSFKDFLDIDADNDGILDNIEAQTTAGYRAPNQIDADNDGLVGVYDGNEDGQVLIPINTDANYVVSDNIPDYLDLDSDNDGAFDYYEAFDVNHNKIALDNLVQRAQNFQNAANNGYFLNRDINGFQDNDDVPDWLESQVANKPNFLSANNAVYYHDTDQDGLVDLFDPDSFGVTVVPSALGDEADFRSEQVIVPLPVELIYFKAKYQNRHVALSWATASEKNSQYFIVERSADGKTFSPIGQVNAAGTSNQVKEYAFMDEAPLPGVTYYRLKQVDFNLSSRNSKVVWVNARIEASPVIKLYPNPAQDKVTIEFSATTDEQGTLVVLNARGQQVKTQKLDIKAGQNSLLLQVQDLASGMYVVIINGPGLRYNVQLIKN